MQYNKAVMIPDTKVAVSPIPKKGALQMLEYSKTLPCILQYTSVPELNLKMRYINITGLHGKGAIQMFMGCLRQVMIHNITMQCDALEW